MCAKSQLASCAWADRLRTLATFMVIAIHVSGPLAEQLPDMNTWEWWYSNWWDGISRASVPLFVLLSGGLLLTKDYPTGDFLKKRLSRVLVPGIFWMIVYLLYGYLARKEPATIPEAAVRLVEGPVHYHLWFIYLITGLYFVYPLLRPWVRQARDRDYWYVFALCALAAWGYKLGATFFDIKLGLYAETFSNNVDYFVLGAYLIQKPLPGEAANSLLSTWPYSRRQMTIASIVLILLGSTFTVVGTYYASVFLNEGKFHRYFYDYLTPNVGMAVIGFFLLARLQWNKIPLLEIEKELASASFGIYLVHVLVMDWWAQCGYWFGAAIPQRSIPVIVPIVYISSFLLVKVIQTLPFGKRIT